MSSASRRIVDWNCSRRSSVWATLVLRVFFYLHREEFQNLPDFFSFLGKVVGLDYLKNRAVPMENLDPQKQPVLKFHFEPSFGSKCFCAVGSFC